MPFFEHHNGGLKQAVSPTIGDIVQIDVLLMLHKYYL